VSIDASNNDLLPADTFDLDADGDTTEPIPFDLAGNARLVNGTVDMGAYEFVAPVLVPGDLNGDEMVGRGGFGYCSGELGTDRAAGGGGGCRMGRSSGCGGGRAEGRNAVRAPPARRGSGGDRHRLPAGTVGYLDGRAGSLGNGNGRGGERDDVGRE